MTDVYSKAKRSAIMSRVRTKRTEAEEKVAGLLKELGISCRRNVKKLPGKPDFVIYPKRTVIFVNGCFWHGHPNCNRAKLPASNRSFWAKKIQNNKRRDARTRRALRQQGWHVWVIWECQLKTPTRILRRLGRLA